MKKISQFLQYVRHDLRYYAIIHAELKGFDYWKELKALFDYVFKGGPKPEYIQTPEELAWMADEDWWDQLFYHDLRHSIKKQHEELETLIPEIKKEKEAVKE